MNENPPEIPDSGTKTPPESLEKADSGTEGEAVSEGLPPGFSAVLGSPPPPPFSSKSLLLPEGRLVPFLDQFSQKTDRELAELAGIKVPAVWRFRKRWNLPKCQDRRGPRKPKAPSEEP